MLLRALAGIGEHDDAGLGLVGGLHDGGKIVVKSRRHDQHGGAKLIQRHEHLLRSLRLRHDAHLVFHRQHFGDARAENCLVIGQNQFEHVVNAPRKSTSS